MSLVQSDSDTGDHCHYNLMGMTDKLLKKFLRSNPITAFEYCNSGQPHSLTLEILEELSNAEGANDA